MQKIKIVIVVLFIGNLIDPSSLKACGWDPYEIYSYHLFDQHYIDAEGYDAFIKEHLYGSWESYHDEPVYTKNIQLWKVLLPGWTSENIQKALSTGGTEVFENLWYGKKDGFGKRVYDYMVYARNCSEQHSGRKRDPWSYGDILEEEQPDLTAFIEEGYEKFNAETNQQLKLRYAYQIIRNYHYSKNYREAIHFFTENIQDKFSASEMYYYVMDQVAGCYYSLEDYSKAAYLFLQVFGNSYDRKVSAYTSYKFCTDRGGEGTEYFKTVDDKAIYITLKSIRSYTNSLGYLSEMSEIAPQSEKLELLFVRTLYDIEDNAFPKSIGLTKRFLLCSDSVRNSGGKSSDILQISLNQETKCKPQRKDFWRLCSSYLYFLNADFVHANKKLNEIQEYNKYAKLGEQLRLVYQVFEWDKFGEAEQVKLASILNSKKLTEENIGLMKEYAGHILYHQGDLAQSFLMHNSILEVKNMGSLHVLEKLKEFILKPVKTPLEQWLFKQSIDGQTALLKPAEFMDYQIGLYYLNIADPKTAYTYLSGITDIATHTGIGQVVPAKVFSNNRKECFACSDSLMEDSVYLASVFSFIPGEMSKKQLCYSLLKLDSLASTSEVKPWKRKLAYYLLGNYYFNVCNTGYYRGALKDDTNCCNSWYLGKRKHEVEERNEKMKQQDGYNLCDVSFSKLTYYGLADKAYECYRHTIDLSADRELNARCLYMMAKCELNDMYNHEKSYEYWDYDGNMDKSAGAYKKSFKELLDEYQDTKFFNRVIKECSFFRYYCTQ